MLTLTDSEKAMLDGRDGKARQKAMDLLVRYAEALGAERFVDTRNVAGVPGSANPFLQRYYAGKDADGLDAIFSYFDLDSDELVEVPDALVPTYHLQGGADPRHWQTLGVKVEVFTELPGARGLRRAPRRQHPEDLHAVSRRQRAGDGRALRLDGIVGRDLRQLGARSAHQHRGAREHERRDADRQDPRLGPASHECRFGTHRVDVQVPVESVMDWGMLGYYVGDVVQEHIPVVAGIVRRTRDRAPEALRRVGVFVRRRRDVSHRRYDAGSANRSRWRLARNRPVEQFTYGEAERRQVYDRAQRQRQRPERGLRDAGMSARGARATQGSRDVARGKAGQRATATCGSSRRARCDSEARRLGYVKAINDAGGVVLTDTCSAFAQAIPPGTKVAALDSAKQAHYLPAILGVQAWFGSTRDCIQAAVTGRWNGERP